MKPEKKQSGFTIIEVLIASIILVLTVSSVVVTMRTSRDIQMNDLLRRQARAHIQTELETTLDYRNYASIANATNNVSINLFAGSAVTATKTTVVNVVSNYAVSGMNLEAKVCTVSVRWNTQGSVRGDSVKITKILTNIL